MRVEDLDLLASRFQSCTISKPEWTHQAHLRVGAWHVHRFGADEAIRLLRTGIRCLNDSHGTPNSESRGYHETITIAYVRLIARFLSSMPAGVLFEKALEQLMESELAGQDFLLGFYTRPLLMSVRARTEWVEPDIAPL